MLEETQKQPLAAFPLGLERKDALSRVGISAELLDEHGIDLGRDGLTLGLARPDETGLPARRLGGVEVRLISDDEHCCYPLLPVNDEGATTYPAGDGVLKTDFSNGTSVYDFADGGGVLVDKDGKVIVEWYVNPEADPVSEMPTPEQEKDVLRLRGATIRAVEGWLAPETGDGVPRDPRSLILLIDPAYSESPALVFDRPNLADAQPETRDDLPRPGVPAPGGEGVCPTGCK